MKDETLWCLRYGLGYVLMHLAPGWWPSLVSISVMTISSTKFCNWLKRTYVSRYLHLCAIHIYQGFIKYLMNHYVDKILLRHTCVWLHNSYLYLNEPTHMVAYDAIFLKTFFMLELLLHLNSNQLINILFCLCQVQQHTQWVSVLQLHVHDRKMWYCMCYIMYAQPLTVHITHDTGYHHWFTMLQ